MGIWNSDSFGMKYRKDTKNLIEFYRHIYYDFGLTSPHLLNGASTIPVRVTSGWSDNLSTFEIRGNISLPSRFMHNGVGIFHTISRNFRPAKGGVWAFDITRLHEGILSGETRWTSDAAYIQSEEYLKVLRLIGASTRHDLSSVPSVGLLFGPLWERFGIPDRIDFRLDSIYPLADSDLLRIVDLISHSYHKNGAPVSFSYSGNPATGTMVMTPQEAVQRAYVPPTPPQPQHSAPAPAPQQKSDDGFPYEFYRGIGLIDDDDMVRVPTALGIMLFHMTHDWSKEALLAYQPEG